jgi:hypothetical protein
MPGTLHQGLLALFQEDPWLAFDVLGIKRPIRGTPIDRRAEIERDGKQPLTVRQGYPDLVLDPQMSRALRAWSVGGPPKLDVLLIDVQTVKTSPWLDDPARRPTAAVLAAVLHGFAGNFEAARQVFHFVRTMAGKRGRRHGMTILAALPPEQRDQLIGEVPVQDQHDWMDVERRSGTYAFGRREGREEGREEAREFTRALIFELLAERGLAVDAGSEVQIRSCDDLSTLQRWVRRAVHATSVRGLLES